MKPFLILQLRPEDEASDNEYDAFLKAGGLNSGQTKRVRMEKEGLPEINLDEFSAVVVGGGPYCVSDKIKPPKQMKLEKQLKSLLNEIIERDFPYLGACYGLGILSDFLGGVVSKEKYSEGVGAINVRLSEDGVADPLLINIDREFRALGGHKESCQNLPERAKLLGGSETCPIQIIKLKNNIYATQFHAELDGSGLAVRIDVYRHAGYFNPEEADAMIAVAEKEIVTEPEKIFRNFVDKYKRNQG